MPCSLYNVEHYAWPLRNRCHEYLLPSPVRTIQNVSSHWRPLTTPTTENHCFGGKSSRKPDLAFCCCCLKGGGAGAFNKLHFSSIFLPFLNLITWWWKAIVHSESYLSTIRGKQYWTKLFLPGDSVKFPISGVEEAPNDRAVRIHTYLTLCTLPHVWEGRQASVSQTHQNRRCLF